MLYVTQMVSHGALGVGRSQSNIYLFKHLPVKQTGVLPAKQTKFHVEYNYVAWSV